jgi:hypothetical protein
VILTTLALRIYIIWQGTNVKTPDEDIEMSKHVQEYILCKIYSCDISCAFEGCKIPVYL